MAHRDNDGKPGPAQGGHTAGQGRDEFEDAVTTEISGVVRRAFGDDFPNPDHSEIKVTDINLSAGPIPAEFELLEPGYVLNDRFEIVELVHSGGMSHVYRAVDLRRHRRGSGPIHVAIKTMRRMVASQQESRMSLEREASRAQRLSHPNIINVFDFDEHEGCFYLVMEWLEGESVNALLKRTRGQRLDPSFAWPIIEGAAAAVQHAHMNNIVHADINPSNIFITSTHEIKLLDFGVARDCGDKSDVAESRLAWATQTYSSPELLDGTTPVFEDDIFSLGCVAYRLLSGEHPFSGSTSIEARDQDMKVAPIAGLSDEDWQTIRRCLDYNRANRPKTAAVFYRNVQRQPGGDRSDRRSALRPGRWLLGAAVVALLAAAGWWAWSNFPQLGDLVSVSEPTVTADTTAVARPADSDVPAPATLPQQAETEVSLTEALLAEAELAMAEQRYLEPASDNALDRYQQVLSVEPENPAALRGLRLISDAYVREAGEALQAGEPSQSIRALQLAREVDASNPGIALVDSLLVAAGNQRLVAARTAAAAGDVARTVELLAVAEQFGHIDVASLEQVRDVLAERLRTDELLESIADVDEHIANGRLLDPITDNAHTLLLELVAVYGEDATLLAAKERLGARLLSNAAQSAGAGDYEVAIEYLDAVDALSVAIPEVAAARSSLLAAIEATKEEAATAQASTEPASNPVVDSSAETASPAPVAVNQGEIQGAAVDDAAPLADEPGSVATPAAVAEQPPQVRVRTLSDLGIQRFVAPSFPRSARRRGISGFVEVGFTINADGTTGDFQVLEAVPADVFNKSAEKAVRQWRFEARDRSIPARIVLTFNVDS